MRNVLILAWIAAMLPQLLPANEIYKFIPRHSQQVLQVNFQDIAGMETVRQDLVSNLKRQVGLDQKKDQFPDFTDSVEKIIIATPNLMADENYIFVKLKIKKEEFCRRIEELTGSKLVPAPGTNPVEQRFILQGNRLFPGVELKKRTFALAFLAENVAVIAKDDLSDYRKFKETGLSAGKRKELTVPKALAAGFAEIPAAFLAENPYLPRIQRAVYSLAGGNDGALIISAAADCADENSANQTLMQVQQYIMVGAMILNQLDPELMQEWMTAVKANRMKTTVSVSGVFSRRFVNRLAEASEQLAGTLNQPEAAGKGEKR